MPLALDLEQYPAPPYTIRPSQFADITRPMMRGVVDYGEVGGGEASKLLNAWHKVDPAASVMYDERERRVYASGLHMGCLLYTSPSPRDGLLSRMPSSA